MFFSSLSWTFIRKFCNLVLEICALFKTLFEELSKTKALYYSWLWIYFVVVVVVERVVSLISNCSPNWSTQCSLSCLHSNRVVPPWKLAVKASEEHYAISDCILRMLAHNLIKKGKLMSQFPWSFFKDLSSLWKQLRI